MFAKKLNFIFHFLIFMKNATFNFKNNSQNNKILIDYVIFQKLHDKFYGIKYIKEKNELVWN